MGGVRHGYTLLLLLLGCPIHNASITGRDTATRNAATVLRFRNLGRLRDEDGNAEAHQVSSRPTPKNPESSEGRPQVKTVGPQLDTRDTGTVDIEIDRADPFGALDACFAAGWTDGLPVIPPTQARVDAMLAAGPWAPDEMLVREPVRDRLVSARLVAANAVMAGCLPEYFPVVGAIMLAISHPHFGLHPVATSTGGAGIVVIVNGPIRDRLGINYRHNLLGPGTRANMTIGRTVRLVLRNCLGALPGILDQSTQGWPGKLACCFAEHEDSSPWEPFHQSLGFSAGTSTVTVFASESGHDVVNHSATTPESLLVTFADAMRALGSFSPGRSLIVFAPEHAKKLARWSRSEVQHYLYEHATRTLSELKNGGKVEDGNATDPIEWFRSGSATQPGDERRIIHRGASADDIFCLVGGGDAGGHSTFFPSWSRGRSVTPITQEIPQ